MKDQYDRITNLRTALAKIRDAWTPPHGWHGDCEHPICRVPRIANDVLRADEVMARD